MYHPRRWPLVSLAVLALMPMLRGDLCGAEKFSLKDSQRGKAVGVIRRGFAGDDFWPSMHAAEALSVSGYGATIVDKLEEMLSEEKDDQRRCGLARELVRAGHVEAKQVLLDILAGKDPHGHIHAAESMYKVNVVGDGKALRSALENNDSKPVLRIMAAAALGKQKDAAAMKFLRSQVLADDPDTFRLAAWVLARIGEASDIPNIKRRAANAKDPLARCFCEHALAALGDADGKQALLQNLRSKDPAVRTYAAIFAGESGLTEAKPQLLKMLDDPHPDAAIRAAQSLLVLEMQALKSDR